MEAQAVIALFSLAFTTRVQVCLGRQKEFTVIFFPLWCQELGCATQTCHSITWSQMISSGWMNACQGRTVKANSLRRAPVFKYLYLWQTFFGVEETEGSFAICHFTQAGERVAQLDFSSSLAPGTGDGVSFGVVNFALWKNGPDQGFLQEPAAAFHAGLGQGQVPISTAVTVLACLAVG